MMKAIRIEQFGDPKVMRVKNTPIPTPSDGQLLVKIHATGVNPVDTYIRNGTYTIKPNLPYTPGTDAAGVIAAVGSDVTDFAVGNRVYTCGSITGTCAEYALCEPHQAFQLPANTSFSQGAAIGVPAATAWRALFQRGNATAGEMVLIHGASGGVGMVAVQLAKAAGLTVVATASTDSAQALLRTLGANQVFNHHNPAELDALTANPPDLIIDMLANINLPRDLAVIKTGGRIVIVGSRGPVEINPRTLMQKEADIKGLMLFASSDKELIAAHQGIVRALANGSLSPIINHTFTLEQAAEAHQAAMQPGHSGKTIISMEKQ